MSQTPQQRFKHKELPNNLGKPFRIAILQKCNDDSDPISCRILDTNFEKVKHTPYKAISHAWGSMRDPPKRTIKVDDQEFEIVENAWCLLVRLRNKEKDVHIWMDMLCIDQGRDEKAKKEKSQQVSIMGEIYKNSNEGVIWLGEPADVAQMGTSTSESAGMAVSVLTQFAASTSFEKMKYFGSNGVRIEVNDDSKPLFIALQNMLNVTWWTRIWVIQEMVLPNQIEFRYGDQMFTFEKLKAVKNALTGEDQQNQDLRNRFLGEAFDPLMVFEEIVVPMITTREEYHHSEVSRKKLTLSELRMRFAASNASWKQDLFYGLLGMAHWDPGNKLEPDYTLPAMHAVRKAVEHCLKIDMSMDFLYGLRRRNDFMSGDPSWLPDFHVQATPSRIAWGEQYRFRIAKYFSDVQRPEREAHPKLLEHGSMVLQAIKVDTVECVGDMCDPLNELPNVPGILNKWMGMMLGNDVEWPESPNEFKKDNQDAFWKTIINNCVPNGNSYMEPNGQHYSAIRDLWKLLQPLIGLFCVLEFSPTPTSDNGEVDPRSAGKLAKALENRVFEKTPGLAYHFLVCLWKRRMVRTKEKRIGLAPEAVKQDDQIWVPLGSSVPFIVRPCCDGRAYSVIGNPYVHGLLNRATHPTGEPEELVLH